MKRILFCGALFTCLLALLAVPRGGDAQTASSWSTFHGDGQRDGVMNANGIKDLTALQTYQIKPNGAHSSPAIDSNGVAYIGDDSGTVYAFDPTKPSVPRWTFVAGGAVRSSVTLASDGSAVYFGSDDGKVYALSTADGHKLWDFSLNTVVRSSPLLSRDGKAVYVNTNTARIVSLSTANGSVNWSCLINAGSTPASMAESADGGSIYIATSDRKVFSLASGGNGGNCGNTTNPPVNPDYTPVSTPAIDPNGNLWINTEQGSVNSFAPQQTDRRWTPYRNANMSPIVSSEAFYNGQAIIGSGNNVVELSQSTGQQTWQFATNGPIEASPAVAKGNGRIYAASSDGFVYVLDKDGNLLTKRDTLAPIDASPAIASDGTVWVASESGTVYRFGDTPVPPSPIPTPVNTVVVNTATPTATATPLVTSTPVPPTSTPTPTATATSVAVPLSITVKPGVKDGAKQIITITSAPNTVVKIRIDYPNGDHQSHSVTTDASGKATYTYKQGGSKGTHTKFKTTVTAKAGSGSSANSTTATYQLSFGTMDVSAEPRKQSVGKKLNIFVHAKAGTKVTAYLLAPSGRLIALGNGKTGHKGFATFHYKIAKGLVTSKNRKVIVIAKSFGVSAKTTFTVA